LSGKARGGGVWRASAAALVVSVVWPSVVFAARAPKGDGPRETRLEPRYEAPLVWILMGLPGDEERRAAYGETVQRLAGAFRDRFGLGDEDVTVLFGRGDLAPYGPCDAESLSRELERVCERSKGARPIWLFFLGHANSSQRDVYFNLAGPDVSAREIARRLAPARRESGMVVFVTTAASGKFLKPLASPGRVVVSATEPSEPDNETEFPRALADALEDPESDLDRNGTLSALEIFEATKRRVEEIYRDEELLQRERPTLDGNGDGEGTTRPAEKDAGPAQRFELRIRKDMDNDAFGRRD